MDCSSWSNQTTRWETDYLHATIPKALLLILLLIVIVASNVAVILRVTHRSRKWMAVEHIIKTLAALGTANGVLNVSAYIITTCTGKRFIDGFLLGKVV